MGIHFRWTCLLFIKNLVPFVHKQSLPLVYANFIRFKTQSLKKNKKFTPLLVRTKCWGKSKLPGAGYNIYTYVRMEIFNFGSFSLAILEKMHFLCFLGWFSLSPTKSSCFPVFSACSLLSEIIIDIIANIYRSIFIYTVFGFLKFLPFLAIFCRFWPFLGFQWGSRFFGSASELQDNWRD